MIYLLRSPAWEKERGYFQILKIGWSDDSKPWLKGRLGSRKRSYKSHNPTSEVLLEIPGQSIEVEEALHDKFSTHRYGGMDEWYEFVPEIIDFFHSPDILAQLQELESKGKELKAAREWAQKERVYNYYLLDILPEDKQVPISADSTRDWILQAKSLLSNIEFISLENEIESYEVIKNSRSKDLIEVFHKIVKAKSIEKRIEILENAYEWLPEEDASVLETMLDGRTKKKYLYGE